MQAAAYARYSTQNQTANSIAYQMEAIRKYCDEHDITIVATFSDEGESATNTDRPGFQEMLAAAHRREFDAIVVYDISRGSRDVGDWFSFRKEMMLLGVQVIAVSQNLGDLTDSNAFLLELLTTGLGQHEVLATRQKSIDGVAVKAKQGQFLGGTPPLGYDIVNGAYVINPGEANTVRTIFQLYAAGESYNTILEAINGAKGKRGRPLGKNSLHSILTNERYIGTYTWNKRRVKLLRKWAGGTPNPKCVRIEGIIPAIIDEPTWEKVKKRMNDNKRNAKNKAKRTYLLSGLIECEECGAIYVGHTSTSSKGYQTRYYVCGNKYRTHTCTAKNINADEIESFVIDQLRDYFAETDFKANAQRIADQINNSTPDLRAERAELADVTAQINNGLKAILTGMDIPELRDEVDKLRVRKSELDDIIGRRTARRTPVDPQDIVDVFEESSEKLDTDIQAVIKQHITKIYAHTDGEYSINVGVHIIGCGDTQYIVCATFDNYVR